MAFIIAEPLASPGDVEPNAVVTAVGFFGAANGKLEMLCPLDLGRALMANVEVAGNHDPDQLAREALCELANIVCGSFVGQEFASLGTTTLTLPSQEVLRAESSADWDQALAMDADGMQIRVRLIKHGAV